MDMTSTTDFWGGTCHGAPDDLNDRAVKILRALESAMLARESWNGEFQPYLAFLYDDAAETQNHALTSLDGQWKLAVVAKLIDEALD